MTEVFKRCMEKKVESGLTWNEAARKAGIRVASWMTGIPTSSPSDGDLKALAPVFNTTYRWLKYGEE